MINQFVALLGVGFLLGLKHALDADHVAVVSTMASEQKSLKQSSWLGVFWGLGHTATLLLVGLVVLLFDLAVPPRLALALELVVGAVVIVFGVDVLRKVWRGTIHVHQHRHDGVSHTHVHSHEVRAGHAHNHRALAVGALHGLAGSGALTLLVLTTVPSVPQGVAFILVFGLGSILSMFLISSLIGLPFLVTTRFQKLHQMVQAVAGLTSIGVGLTLIMEIVARRGLFA